MNSCVNINYILICNILEHNRMSKTKISCFCLGKRQTVKEKDGIANNIQP